MENFAKKYYVITYGCQMNIHESEKLSGMMVSLGYSLATDKKDADVIVFNTCCIRENAEKKAEGNIGALKSLKKKKKDLIIAVCGCMTQQSGYAEKLKNTFPFIDIIFGTHNLDSFRELLLKRIATNKKIVSVWEKEGEIVECTPKERSSFPNAWVNITYGCNNFCTYCIVPYVRGRERSRNIEDIVKECEQLIKDGYKEITLLGQNVNSYGNDLQNVNFSMLLKRINAIPGYFRIRFMTNHPKDLSRELIETIASCDKVCKSIHLPVQAGSNHVLKLMNRRYTREDYIEKVKILRDFIPDIAITTDIMVGFPQETDDDFLETLSLAKEVGFSGAFTFIYSKRSGTPASKMDGQVDEATATERITKLLDYQNTFNREQSKKYLGNIVEILCEGFDNKKNKYLGRDTFGRMAYFSSDKDIIGRFVKVKITKTGGISLLGEIQQ